MAFIGKKDTPVIFRTWFKLSFMSVAGVLMLAFLLWIPGLFSSFLITIIMVFLLSPLVDWCERHKMSRSTAVTLTMVTLVVIFLVIGLLVSNLLIGEWENFSASLDQYLVLLNKQFNLWTVQVEKQFGLEQFEIADRLTRMGQKWMGQALQFTGAQFTTIATWFAVVPIITFFLLLDGQRIKRAIIGFMPNRYFEMSLNINQKNNEIVGNFIRAKLVESLVVGLCALLGLLVLSFFYERLNYLFILSVIVGLFNVIPYLGPILGYIPVMAVAIVQYVLLPQLGADPGAVVAAQANWAPVIGVAAVLAFAQVVDNVYLIPVLLGRSVNVHPIIVLLSVILGAKTLGITGMLISIPVASIIQTVAREVALGIRELRH